MSPDLNLSVPKVKPGNSLPERLSGPTHPNPPFPLKPHDLKQKLPIACIQTPVAARSCTFFPNLCLDELYITARDLFPDRETMAPPCYTHPYESGNVAHKRRGA
jgi:hypothetical protein